MILNYGKKEKVIPYKTERQMDKYAQFIDMQNIVNNKVNNQNITKPKDEVNPFEGENE